MSLKLDPLPLTPQEQRLYLRLEEEDNNTIKVSEIDYKDLNMSKDMLYRLVRRLDKKKWINRVANGVYLRSPACTSFVKGKGYLEDRFEVGLKMYDEGYIAFQNALNIYGFSEYFSYTIFVATRNVSKTTPLLKDYEIKAIKIGKRFCGFEKYYEYRMSTKAKTFFDCFCHPEYAAEYNHVLGCLYIAREIDWREMEGYLDKFGSSSLCQKIGYMISLLSDETDFKEPTDFLEYLKNRVKTRTKLMYAWDGGEYNKDWKVIDNMGKRNLLAWWYNG